MKVAVLGAGSFGTTIAALACERNDLMLWARRDEVAEEINANRTNGRYFGERELPGRIRATPDLAEAVSHAEVLVVAVPTQSFRQTLAAARPHLAKWVPVVSVAKGFEQGSRLRMTELIAQELPGHPAVALAGPNIAREIMSGMAAASVVATDDPSVGRVLQGVLARGLFRVYYNHDVIGCELGGALKNVVAIACGIAEGLGTGDNTRATVMTRGLAELTRLGIAMGGEEATFYGLTGMGDLVVTCMSPHSRNRTVGERLASGQPLEEIVNSMNMVAEGLKTAPTVMELADQHGLTMPICREIDLVVKGEITGDQAYRGLKPIGGHEREPD